MMSVCISFLFQDFLYGIFIGLLFSLSFCSCNKWNWKKKTEKKKTEKLGKLFNTHFRWSKKKKTKKNFSFSLLIFQLMAKFSRCWCSCCNCSLKCCCYCRCFGNCMYFSFNVFFLALLTRNFCLALLFVLYVVCLCFSLLHVDVYLLLNYCCHKLLTLLFCVILLLLA